MSLNKPTIVLVLLFLILTLRIFQQFPLQADNSLQLESPGLFLELRQKLSQISTEILPQPQAALLNGIILGLKSGLPPEFQLALRNTSTVHIVVASGQNLTLLSGFLLTFAQILGRKKTILASVFICIFYAFLTGLQIPIIRAAVMMIFTSIGQLFDREIDSWFCLSFAALLMLIFEPNWLLSISFQLSFLATIGAAILAPELIKRTSVLPSIIKENLLVSLSAQALTAPLIAAYFQQFSLSGLIVNTLILGVVAPIMVSGTIVLMTSLIILPVGEFLSLIPNILLTYFVYIVNFFNQDWSSIWVGRVNGFIYLGYYLLITAIYLTVRQKNRLIDRVKRQGS